ncbi:MAG: ferredoxin family protein [Candidatus Thorarchaeota archaeon]|nr:ferredoxin family protein [Candidatus Thorarchaeota archaeon]
MLKVPSIVKRSFRFLTSYRTIGRAVSFILGFGEVPLLEFFSFLDKHTKYEYFSDLMAGMTRVYGSRVIPLNVSLSGVPAVSPTEEILNIVSRVESLAIGYCHCRNKNKNCDNEVWTCIHVGTAKDIESIGKQRPLKSATLDEVKDLILKSDHAGLVHQLITAPSSEYFYVICNCCPCCCVMLRSAINHGLGNTALASNFISTHDTEKCTNCGECVDRCYFGARRMEEFILTYYPRYCVGCGLCVPACLTNAAEMRRRKDSEMATRPLKPLSD